MNIIEYCNAVSALTKTPPVFVPRFYIVMTYGSEIAKTGKGRNFFVPV